MATENNKIKARQLPPAQKKMKLRYGRIAVLAICLRPCYGQCGCPQQYICKPSYRRDGFQHRIGGQRLLIWPRCSPPANHLLAERNQRAGRAAAPQRRESHSQQASSSSSSQSSGSSSQASSTPASNGTASSSAPVNNGNSSAASSSGAASSQAPATFDPNSLGASGAANIPSEGHQRRCPGLDQGPQHQHQLPSGHRPRQQLLFQLGVLQRAEPGRRHLERIPAPSSAKGGYQPQHRAVRPQLDQYFGQPPHRKCQ